LAGIQLHWFLNQNCNLALDWTNHKLRTNVNSDTFLLPFLFKWNSAFCLKRHRFKHCSLKKKDPNSVVLNGTVGLLLPLDARNRGRRRFFPPLSPPSSPSKRRRLPFKKTPTQPKAFHVLEWRQHNGRPVLSLPCFLPIKIGEGRARKKERDREKEERSRIGTERREPREKKEKKRRREEKTGEETVRTVIADTSIVGNSCVLPPPSPPAAPWATVGQLSSLSSSTSFFFFTIHFACEQWRSPLAAGPINKKNFFSKIVIVFRVFFTKFFLVFGWYFYTKKIQIRH